MVKSRYRYWNGVNVANRVVEGLPLTERELDVLREISLGLSEKEVAAKLGIARSTVSEHTMHIRVKLGCSATPGCISIAMRRGLMV